jgi:hypothetical protein
VPLRSPTFLAGSRLKETCRGEKAARAGTRGVERVAGNKINPVVLIVKLRNILKRKEEGCGKIEGRRGLNVRAAPRKK